MDAKHGRLRRAMKKNRGCMEEKRCDDPTVENGKYRMRTIREVYQIHLNSDIESFYKRQTNETGGIRLEIQ